MPLPVRNSELRASLMAGLIVLAATLQSGCGESNLTAGIDGSGGPLYAQGPIEAFGSIVVAGEHYEIDNASVQINGAAATANDLQLGQVVSVESRVSLGVRVASAVNFEANLRGPLQSIDTVNGLLLAMGQEIRVGPDTVVDIDSGTSLDALDIDDQIEVSGLTSADGSIQATRVARAADGAELRIVGRAEQVSISSFSFSIGGLTVDYSSAGLIEGFPAGTPTNGDNVLVVGDRLNGSGIFIASRLRLVEADAGRAGEAAEVEGLITRFVSPSDFDVANKPSTTTVSTVYEGGDPSSLQLNVKIQIEGRFDDNGTIVADKIEVKDGGAVVN